MYTLTDIKNLRFGDALAARFAPVWGSKIELTAEEILQLPCDFNIKTVFIEVEELTTKLQDEYGYTFHYDKGALIYTEEPPR